MKPHWNDTPKPFDRSVQNPTDSNAQEIVLGVLIASLVVGAIPIIHSSNLALSPDANVTVPGEATLWGSGWED
ncbi:MAG: hypothetical protein J7641_08805 [Cyanobacteria bacterium SID2]|nr:hypothetical protein [Cyanobacteria bacterium SID2]MBP0005400.1 hypothetical protein [Cyanobacteria bacterium SBC]